MQTGTGKGMQTMEQSLAELILRGVITKETGLSRSSRPEQLAGLLERAGFDDPDAPSAEENANGAAASPAPDPVFGGLRVAGS
jgi:hypothetical protein